MAVADKGSRRRWCVSPICGLSSDICVFFGPSSGCSRCIEFLGLPAMSSNNQKVSTTERVIKSKFYSFHLRKSLGVSVVSLCDISVWILKTNQYFSRYYRIWPSSLLEFTSLYLNRPNMVSFVRSINKQENLPLVCLHYLIGNLVL